MPRVERSADVVWEGNLARGHGTIQCGSGALREVLALEGHDDNEQRKVEIMA